MYENSRLVAGGSCLTFDVVDDDLAPFFPIRIQENHMCRAFLILVMGSPILENQHQSVRITIFNHIAIGIGRFPGTGLARCYGIVKIHDNVDIAAPTDLDGCIGVAFFENMEHGRVLAQHRGGK